MKQVIEGKIYDTTTAEEICQCSSATQSRGDFSHWEAGLYRTKRGRFFLAGSGGPMTRWARSIGQGSTTGGRGIIPVSADEARRCAERAGATAEELANFFSLEEA